MPLVTRVWRSWAFDANGEWVADDHCSMLGQWTNANVCWPHDGERATQGGSVSGAYVSDIVGLEGTCKTTQA
jgi:hypothetical protein